MLHQYAYNHIINNLPPVKFEKPNLDDLINLGRYLRMSAIITDSLSDSLLSDLNCKAGEKWDEYDFETLAVEMCSRFDECIESSTFNDITYAIVREHAESVMAAIEWLAPPKMAWNNDARAIPTQRKRAQTLISVCGLIDGCPSHFVELSIEEQIEMWKIPPQTKPPIHLESWFHRLGVPRPLPGEHIWWSTPLLIASCVSDASNWENLDENMQEDLIGRMRYLGVFPRQISNLPEAVKDRFLGAWRWGQQQLGLDPNNSHYL